jgi:hypothetical protein
MRRQRRLMWIVACEALLALVAATPRAANAADAAKQAPAAPLSRPKTVATPPNATRAPTRSTGPGVSAKSLGDKGPPTTARPEPDLVISSVTIEPISPDTNDSITFRAVLTNTGAATAPASKVAVFVGGETTPATFVQPPLAPNASRLVVRVARLPRAGTYAVKFVADADGVVPEQSETNNIGERSFRVAAAAPRSAAASAAVSDRVKDIARARFAFRIGQASMNTYTSPGNSSFAFYLRPTQPVDTTSVEETAIQVHLRYFANGSLQSEEDLSGHFASKGPDPVLWQSNQTPYARSCTSSSSSYCEVNLTLQDSVRSREGAQLDGDNDGQPGGAYHHQFFRGMHHP